MNNDVQQEMKLRRYLLGELPLEEQVLVEQRLFLDSEYAELQQAVKDDLIDEYLVDELRGSEREEFVNHFLRVPEHGADLRIAEALKKYLATENIPSTETDTNNTHKDEPPGFFPFSFLNKPLVWLSLTVAALIILSVIAWIALRAMRGPAADGPQQAREPQPTQSQPDNRQQPDPVPQNHNRVETAEKGNSNRSPNPDMVPERRSASGRAVISATIYADISTRAGGSKRKVTIYDDTREVVLRLPLEFSESYEKYRAELLSGERKVDEQSNLKSQSDDKFGSVFVTLSPDILRTQSYRIKLYGVPGDQQAVEPPRIYPFNVERK